MALAVLLMPCHVCLQHRNCVMLVSERCCSRRLSQLLTLSLFSKLRLALLAGSNSVPGVQDIRIFDTTKQKTTVTPMYSNRLASSPTLGVVFIVQLLG